MNKHFEKNDLVTIAPAFMIAPEEKNQIYIVLEAFDDVRRARVGLLNTRMALGSSHTWDYDWFELADVPRDVYRDADAGDVITGKELVLKYCAEYRTRNTEAETFAEYIAEETRAGKLELVKQY